jgi:hypothetical protein
MSSSLIEETVVHYTYNELMESNPVWSLALAANELAPKGVGFDYSALREKDESCKVQTYKTRGFFEPT